MRLSVMHHVSVMSKSKGKFLQCSSLPSLFDAFPVSNVLTIRASNAAFMGSLYRRGSVGLGHYICVCSFFFSFPPHCTALSHLPPLLPTDAQPSSPPNHNAIHSTTTVTATPPTAQQQQLQHQTWCNNSNHDAICGTTTATMMPYMVQ